MAAPHTMQIPMLRKRRGNAVRRGDRQAEIPPYVEGGAPGLVPRHSRKQRKATLQSSDGRRSFFHMMRNSLFGSLGATATCTYGRCRKSWRIDLGTGF
jgi:hypothetical protein